VPDHGRAALPRLYSCRDEVIMAAFPTSNVSSRPLTTYSRAVNIDKPRSQYTVSTMEPSNQIRGFSGANAKETRTETADVRPMTSQSDVTTTPEVHPTYVRSAPVMRMLSESQPIQTTAVSSPMFVDCRKADIRKLPTLIDPSCQSSAEHLSTGNDWIVSSTPNPAAATDTKSPRKLLDSGLSSPADESKHMADKNRRLKSETTNMAATSAVTSTQRNSLREDTPRAKNSVSYVTAIDSSSFICRRCCRSLTTCKCASTADTGALCREKHRPDVDSGGCGQSNDGGKTVPLKSTDGFTATASRSATDLYQAVDPSYRRLRPVAGNRPGLGQQDVEMRRMMASLETIDNEWTSCRPLKSSQPMHSASDMNNNNNNNNNSPSRPWESGSIIDERQLTSGHLNQREIFAKLTATRRFLEIGGENAVC